MAQDESSPATSECSIDATQDMIPNPATPAYPSSCGTSMSLLLTRPRFTLPTSKSELSCSKRLEAISVDILMALDNDTTGNPAYKYLAPNHQAEFPGDGVAPPVPPITTHTKEAFIKLRAGAVSLHPEIHLEVLDTASSVDDKLSKATVWLRGFLTSYESADMMTRESVAMLEWRRFQDCDWICTRSVFTHGYSGIRAGV